MIPDSLKPDDRDVADAAEMIIGGAFAAVAFEAYRRLFKPLDVILELAIGAGLAIIMFLVITYLAALVFSILESDVPQPSMNLTDEALENIADRMSDLDASELDGGDDGGS
jgi:hypothetical protein